MWTIAPFFINNIINVYHGNILFMPKSGDIYQWDEGVMFVVSFVFLPHKHDQGLLDFLVFSFTSTSELGFIVNS
jgi:hypothetical protein